MTLSYVIIVPVFLIGIMTIVQASIWYLAKDSVLAAARHGADVARTSQPPPGTGAQSAVSFATSSTSSFLSDVTASAKGTTGTTVRISVSARIPSLVPGLMIRVHEVVTAPVERFVADAPLLPLAMSAEEGNKALHNPAATDRARLGRSAGPAVGTTAAAWNAAGSRPRPVRS